LAILSLCYCFIYIDNLFLSSPDMAVQEEDEKEPLKY
jgi:hypothetical protein